jgi:hypothetical protein
MKSATFASSGFFYFKLINMIIRNITYSVDKTLEQDFLEWIKAVHIPEVMMSLKPQSYKILRLLTEIENAGATFSVQYFFESLSDFEDFENEFQEDLNYEVHKRYNGHYVFFPSLLEEI